MKHLDSFMPLAMFSFFLVSCTQDSDISSEIESIDLTTIINPDTARAEAEFDNTAGGIYKGVFVSNDIAYHGVLTVNLGNDSKYNAILEYGDDQSIGFVCVPNTAAGTSNVIEFRGANTGFKLDVTDDLQIIVSEAYIDGQTAQARLLKETSRNQVRAVLGTFSDDSDLTFTGTWDFLSTLTEVVTIPTGLGFPFPSTVDVTVNVISEVVLTKNATLFSDDTLENFTPGAGCGVTLPAGSQAPFFSGPQVIVGIVSIDEYAAVAQTSTFVGEECNWSFIYSFAQGGKYFDINCTETPLGGTWSWKGRTGKILLE